MCGTRANNSPLELSSLPRLIPSSTVPFRRDQDFIDCEILSDIRHICSLPASRAAIIGLGGVGWVTSLTTR
jgi:hypothetical protein